jgi:aminoglycoside 3-N-acetyltransferase
MSSTGSTRVLGPDRATAIRSVSALDDSDGIVQWAGEDYFAVLLRDYLALGRARTGRVGDAPSELIDAADLLEYGVDWMNDHLVREGVRSSR